MRGGKQFFLPPGWIERKECQNSSIMFLLLCLTEEGVREEYNSSTWMDGDELWEGPRSASVVHLRSSKSIIEGQNTGITYLVTLRLLDEEVKG